MSSQTSKTALLIKLEMGTLRNLLWPTTRMQNYSLIAPSVSLWANFAKLTHVEARSYFGWFQSQIPIRIETLQAAVSSSDNLAFRNWRATKTPDSLDILGTWFAETAKIRQKTDAEKQRDAEFIASLPDNDPKDRRKSWYKPTDWMLTDITISLIYDVGMYLGEVFTHSDVRLSWILSVKTRKSDFQYQKPVVTGFGKIDCDPIGLVHVIALKYIDKSSRPSELLGIYNYWNAI